MSGEERRIRTIAIPSHPDHFEDDMERRRRIKNIWVVKVHPGKWEPRNPDKYGCPSIPSFHACLGCEAIGKCYTLTKSSRGVTER